MDRAALADFRRHRREALPPADIGIPVSVRRRAPGLRREDVAALARALRLTSDERDYLFQLAGHSTPAPTTAGLVQPGQDAGAEPDAAALLGD